VDSGEALKKPYDGIEIPPLMKMWSDVPRSPDGELKSNVKVLAGIVKQTVKARLNKTMALCMGIPFGVGDSNDLSTDFRYREIWKTAISQYGKNPLERMGQKYSAYSN